MAKATATKSEKKDSKKQSGTHVTHIDVGDIPQYAMDSGIINIDLDSVIPDPNQPRKFFNEQDLHELAQSIIQVGVIEPVLVRPVDGDQYMIVFGERRFRASKLAQAEQVNVNTIPAMVRTLTDDEALELQITENLQRHDPHPMEEAASFNRMREKYDVNEIALRAGKSTKFIANRLLLNNLLPDFQEMFFTGIIPMADAFLLAKISTDGQDAIFKEVVGKKDWRKSKNFQLYNISNLVRTQANDLSKAPFKTTDATLYPEMGACDKCQYNSQNNLLLFTEEKGRTCTNAVCFNIKCSRAYTKSIEEVMTDPTILFVAGYFYGKEASARVDAVKKMGVHVFTEYEWREVTAPGKKPTWAAFEKDSLEDWDEEEETKEEFLANQKEVFDDEVKEWEQLTAAFKDGTVKKAFVVVGNKAGKIINVMLKTKGGNKVATDGSVDAASQIVAIELREKRAKELDAEKVWAKVRSLATADGWKALRHDGPLSDSERVALSMAIYDSLGYSERDYFTEQVLKQEERHYRGTSTAMAIEKINEGQFNQLARLLLSSKLYPPTSSHDASSANYCGKKVVDHYFPAEVKAIEDEQKEKTDKRVTRVNQRIAALKNDKS